METSWVLISCIDNEPTINALPLPVWMLIRNDQGAASHAKAEEEELWPVKNQMNFTIKASKQMQKP